MAGSPKNSRIHCGDPFSETAHGVIGSRLTELVQQRAEISGPEDSVQLHALRIAAKRLRYSLEMFGVAFPTNEAQERADAVRAMQDLLGRIHDLDVLHELLLAHIATLDAERRERAATLATNGEHADWEAGVIGLLRSDGTSDGRLGLYKVLAAKATERRELYGRFVALWGEWETDGFLDALRTSIDRAESN